MNGPIFRVSAWQDHRIFLQENLQETTTQLMGHVGHIMLKTKPASCPRKLIQDDEIMIFLPGPRKAVNRVLEAADGSLFSAFPVPRVPRARGKVGDGDSVSGNGGTLERDFLIVFWL